MQKNNSLDKAMHLCHNVNMAAKQQNLTAIIYDRKGKVLSIGKNSYVKTHPLQAKHASKVGKPENIVLHAEIDAIIRCRNLDKAYRIFVSRINKSGDTRLAKPCAICMSAIGQTKIQKIEWTIDNGENVNEM